MNAQSLVIRTITTATVLALVATMALFSYQVARAEEPVEPAPQVVVTEEVAPQPEPVVEEPVIEEVAEEPVVEEVIAETPVEVEEVPAETPPAEEVVEEVVTEEVVAESAPLTASVISAFNPELTTDKGDYHPGETATIFGKFFNALTTYVFKVFGSDDVNENYTESVREVTTDESGLFTETYTLDSIYRPFYEVVIATLFGDEVASSWFRDSSVGTYDQCSNNLGTGYTTGDQGCRWINGNLNGGNSTYLEGDATVQRLWIEGFVPGSSHTVSFKYGTTKAGHHAYDYLTNWSHSENWIADADRCQGITGCTSVADSFGAMQDDLNVPNIGDPNGIEPSAASRNFTIRGATITNVSQPSVISGTYGGDSETVVTVTFTTAATGTPMCIESNGPKNTTIVSCGVALWFGAHIAKTTEWNAYDNTTGAGSINGSPYHVALAAIDSDPGQGGGRDNQMSASVIPSQIIIRKDTNPDAPQDFAFTTTGTGLSNFTLDDDGEVTVLSNLRQFSGLSSGNYTVTETAQAGYAVTISCTDPTTNTTVNNGTRTASIALAQGETVECVFTNTLQQGTLTLQKTVVSDNGGNAADAAWTLNASGPTPITGTEGQVSVTNAAVNAGSYTLTETNGPAGYTQTGLSCTGGTLTGNQVTVAAGANVVCTFTNDDDAPSLTLVKQVINDNGGTAVAGAWTLTATGYDAQSPDAGTYNLSESGGPAGYTQTSLTCSDSGDAQVTSVTLGLGEQVTCTFVNDDVQPTLTLVKTVVNNNGGLATAANFQGKIDGNNVSWSVAVPVSAGAHTASETTLPGYSPSAWGGDCAANGSVSLAVGQNKTCTITNDDQQAYITVAKVVENDNGGSAQPNDFLLTLEGNAVSSGVAVPVNPGTYTASESQLTGYTFEGFSGDCDSNGDVTVALGESKTCTLTNDDDAPSLTLVKQVINDNGGDAEPEDFTLTAAGYNAQLPQVGSYNLSESGPAGYTQTSLTCDNAEGEVTSVTLGLGEDVTCTFVNDDIAPQLTVIKHVVNDNGGTADAGDFTMNIAATDPSDASFAGDEAGVTITLDAGNYVVSEQSDENGYNGSFSTDCTGSIGIGESKTCTVTNNDVAPTLHLRKVVVNDNGGLATVADFTLTADGTGANDLSGTTPVDSTGTLQADTWTLGETTNTTGYAASAWSCVGGVQNGSAVTLAIGEEATCTITNDDIQPKLTVIKHVVNDNGGTADASDFSLIVNFATNPNPAGQFPGSETGTVVMLDAGSYGVAESVVSGYMPSFGAGCAGTIAIGEEKTCTVTNDDIAPKLTITKTVVNDNGGTKVVSDFPLFVNGNAVTSGVENTLTANVLYTATETNAPGYAASQWGGDCAANGTITLLPGDVKNCTITNDDIAPVLHLRKVLINDNGGEATLASFVLTADGTGANDVSGTSPVDSTGTLQSDTFALSETNIPGYIASPWVCVGGTQVGSNIAVGIGQEATCTITNNDTPGHFTGGGSIFPSLTQGAVLASLTSKTPVKDTRVTHGFTLHCDASRDPNRLEVNWGPAQNSQKFHLLNLDSAVCTDNPLIDPQQPNADFDTIAGTGTGRFQAGKKNEVPAKITFTFDDAGEPGRNDTAKMRITSLDNAIVFLDTFVALNLNMGNQQAHQDN